MSSDRELLDEAAKRAWATARGVRAVSDPENERLAGIIRDLRGRIFDDGFEWYPGGGLGGYSEEYDRRRREEDAERYAESRAEWDAETERLIRGDSA